MQWKVAKCPKNEGGVKCWIAEVVEKSPKLLTALRRIFLLPLFQVPGLRWRAERFLSRSARIERVSPVRLAPQIPVSPPNARYTDKEFPSENGGFALAVQGSAPGKWSVPYHPQTSRRPAREYRPRDIGLPPEGRERLSNGPCSTVSSPVVTWSMVRKSQFLYSWLYSIRKGKT